MIKPNSFMGNVLLLIFPENAVCMGCGDVAGMDEGWLCDDCREELAEIAMAGRELCPRCGMELNEGARCRNCASWPDDAVQVARYCYGYASPADTVIKKMKYGAIFRMTEWMGAEVAQLLEQGAYGRIDYLVPVPMHPVRRVYRHRNHALCIAEAISEVNGIPVWDGLRKRKNTRQQAKRRGEARRKAMSGAYGFSKDAGEIAGKRIVLIDDVITTGTTVNSCAKLLYANGAERVCAAAFAGHLSAAENTRKKSDT